MDSALYLHESLPAAFFSEPVVIHPGKSGSRTVENAAFSASTPMLYYIQFCYVYRRPYWWGGVVNLFGHVTAFNQSVYSIDQSN